MSVRDFLSTLQGLDVRVWAEGDRIRINAPQGALTPELKEELRRRKLEILAFLAVAERTTELPDALVPLKPEGSRPPVFAVPGHNGDVFCYVRLVEYLNEDQPFYALQPPGLDGKRDPALTIEELASYHADALERVRPGGPFYLAGYCLGGTIVFETARELVRRGREVPWIGLFAAPCPTSFRPLHRAWVAVTHYTERLAHHARMFAAEPLSEKMSYVRARVRTVGGGGDSTRHGESRETTRNRLRVERRTVAAAHRYAPGIFPGKIALFLPEEAWRRSGDLPMDWVRFADGGMEEWVGPDGCNGDFLLRDYAEVVAPPFRRMLKAAQDRDGNEKSRASAS